MNKDIRYVYYKSTVLPSMKKDKSYTVMCAIDVTGKVIVRAVCTCPAGTSESCVHVSALLHALECLYESPKSTFLAGSAVGESKTSMQCMWLKPRKRKVSATSAHDLKYIKHEYGKKCRRKSWAADFDPRPPHARALATSGAARQLLCDGLKQSGICAEFLLQ